MATLFKLAISADVQTSITTKPAVAKYFYLFDEEDLNQDGDLVIPAGAFVDDQGQEVENITLVTPDNGYYLLFINGVLQQDSLYSVTANNVTVLDGEDIEPESPIVLVVTNFAPEASTTTTIAT